MGVIHSFSDLKTAFSHAEDASVPRGLRALPDDLRTGSIIHYCPAKIIPDYPKPREFRPGVVMAVWRDDKGAAKIFEVAPVTTKVSSILREELSSTFPGFRLKFPDQPDRKVSLSRSVFVPNELGIVRDRISDACKDGLRSLVPDLLVRRAYSLLWNREVEYRGESPDRRLTRDGFTFENIRPENLLSDRWHPDMLGNGVRSVQHSERTQQSIDAIASFAHYYNRQQHDLGVTRWSFPPYREWPTPIPKLGFVDHDRTYRGPLPHYHS